jgi:histone acetyltransferase (RNA polymerase elongator complex component)
MKALEIIKPAFVRIYPLIVLANTPLWRDYQAGKYNPLSMEEAIGICADYCLLAEMNGFEIIKIGIPSLHKDCQFAGPYHPAFGELVKGEVLIKKIVSAYKNDYTIHIHPRDISLLTGHKSYNLLRLLNRLDLCKLKIKTDTNLKKGEVCFSLDLPSLVFNQGKEVS